MSNGRSYMNILIVLVAVILVQDLSLSLEYNLKEY